MGKGFPGLHFIIAVFISELADINTAIFNDAF